MGAPTHHLTEGEIFGRWVVLGFSRSDRYAGRMWLCRCECGLEQAIPASKLVKGRATGCISCVRYEDPNTWAFRLGYLTLVQKGAKERGLVYDLSPAHLHAVLQRQEGRCSLSGEVLIFAARYGLEQTASIDRIDSSVGYVEGNVQWVHKDINKMKNNLGQERFVELCKKVADMTEAAQVVACTVAGQDC